MKPISKMKKQFKWIKQVAPNHVEVRLDFGRALISYESVVCFIPSDGKGKVVFGKDWDYSRTTMKYLGQWIGLRASEIREGIASGKYDYDEELT